MNSQPDTDGSAGGTLARRVTAAAAWMVAFRWIDRGIGLLSVAILARLLLPEDFGIVGYAMLIIGVLDLFTGISTDAELIRHQLADRAYYSAAWSMNIMRGVATGILMVVLTAPAARFFGEPRLAGVMLALTAVPLIAGFENVGIIEFRKQLNFDREFRFLLATRVFGTVTTLGLAFALRSYWALVAGTLARAVFRVVWSYRVHPFRPTLTLARVPQIFRFSRWMILQNFAAGIQERLPGFVIGREWDSSTLAFFNMGKEIANLSTSEIRAPIRRALYPGIAQIVERRERVGEVLVESTGLLALLTLPMPLGIALIADDLVPIFLGSKWQSTVTVLQPLCVAASLTALGTNSQLAYMALNRSHLAAIATAARALLLFGLLVAVAPTYGVVGVAYAVAGLNGAMVAVDYAMSSRLLKIDTRRFLEAVWRPATASIAMCIAVWLFRESVPAPIDLSQHAWRLARSGLLGGLVYVVCVLGLWMVTGRGGGAERRLFALLKGYFPKR